VPLIFAPRLCHGCHGQHLISNWEDQRAAATDADVPVAVYGLILPQKCTEAETLCYRHVMPCPDPLRLPKPPRKKKSLSGGFHKWGCPNSWIIYFSWKNKNLYDNWGYPHDFGNTHDFAHLSPEV